eukprot:COSAG04_NODE_4147_length_2271_cov_9.877993_2_plen_162_part_00
MVCERAADEGGESYMLDGHAIVRSFPEEQRRQFFEIPVEARDFDGQRGVSAVWRSPMVQRVGGSGRWCLRAEGGGGFNRDQPCRDSTDSGTALMKAWDAARDAAGAAAPRFRLLPGQALIVDNCAPAVPPRLGRQYLTHLHLLHGRPLAACKGARLRQWSL